MGPQTVDRHPAFALGRLTKVLLLAAILVGGGYLLARYVDRQEQHEVEQTSIDKLVVALRENRNSLQVHRLSGAVTTKRATTGGPAGILRGELTVKQPWSVAYFLDMGQLGLDDYIWDERTRTLLVRAPAVVPERPNIDESRQVVAYNGPFITRDMQTRLRTDVARGASTQAAKEAARPENMAAATKAAREALARNLEAPLRAAGLGDVSVQVQVPTDGRTSSEQWDLSRSMEEVLAERARR
jgi:hypothetical protein